MVVNMLMDINDRLFFLCRSISHNVKGHSASDSQDACTCQEPAAGAAMGYFTH
jgi:hypothetical protein